MNRKRALWIGVAVLFLSAVGLAYIFKPLTMDDIYDEPNFGGTVISADDKAIMVAVNAEEDEFKSSDKISVSLNVKLKDSSTHFNVGDKVRVFYDGSIMETYPARVQEVYAVLRLSE